MAKRRGLRIKSVIFGPIAGFPLALVFSILGRPWFYAAIPIAALSVVAGTAWGWMYMLQRCPRCGHIFITIPGKCRFLWYTKRCRHCGFPEV